jgi:DNA invertase Pin-like site-specific DNA recombinase
MKPISKSQTRRMKVLGYVRVSTEEQSEEGVSLDAQIAKIRLYCELHDLELIDVIVDAGESGKSLDRPGIQDALHRLDRRKADGLVIVKLDRLSRNIGDWNWLIAEYFGEKPGKQLWSVGDSIDTRTAAGRLVLNVLMSVAQWEREAISERTRDALRFKKSQGKRVSGRLPYGYELAADGKMLVECEAEQQVLTTIRELRTAGSTLAEIAQSLNERGISKREGGAWEFSYISRLLAKSAA